ncbi:MAG: GTPase ObgE [Nitrospirae bacterium]|nr:GTPase ObgE [Nitrospirota bacterium]
MFVDQVKIFVKAGNGGDGCVAFRREKYVPRGGPNGGHGGNGGDVVLRATGQLRTLLDLRYQQHYLLPHAQHGEGSDCHGKNSPQVVIPVPCGTIVRDAETKEVLADMTKEGQEIIIAKGGRGGRGNSAFATSTNRAPRRAEKGLPGEERWLQLELKLLADVGLVGFPNAGKSTLISRISSARPKIADYPFTTLSPQLGMVAGGIEGGFIVADIPGLIEGAHTGKGLGIQFLKHIERNVFLLYLIDIGEAAEQEPVQSFEILRRELSAYNPELLEKPFAIAATKKDIQGDGGRLKTLAAYCRKKKFDCLPVSAVTGEGIPDLVRYLGGRVQDARSKIPTGGLKPAETT